MKHAFKIVEAEHDVGLSRSAGGYLLHLVGDNGPYSVPVNLAAHADGRQVLSCSGHSDDITLAVDGDDVHIHLAGETYTLRFEHSLDRLAQATAGSAEDIVKATMPGSIVTLDVAAGDSVSAGQTLLIMESMKMETTITAPRDGIVETIHFQPGQTFDKDAILLSLAALEGDDA